MNTDGFSGFSSDDTVTSGIFELPSFNNTPEARLLLALLERSILDYVGNEDKEREEASTWLFDDSDENDYLISFDEVCETLELVPAAVRTKIKSFPRRGDRRVAPWYF